MNLKEAFRYQNFLSGLFDRTLHHLDWTGDMLTVTETHMRSKAKEGAEDEVIVREKSGCIATNDQIIDLAVALIWEQELLGEKIAEVKSKETVDLDSSVLANKKRQSLYTTLLSAIGKYKKEEQKAVGTGYTFNSDGEQVSYKYDIYKCFEPDFDVARAKTLAKELAKTSDNVSADIDKYMITVEVEHNPMFDVNDTWEDVLETFLATPTL